MVRLGQRREAKAFSHLGSQPLLRIHGISSLHRATTDKMHFGSFGGFSFLGFKTLPLLSACVFATPSARHHVIRYDMTIKSHCSDAFIKYFCSHGNSALGTSLSIDIDIDIDIAAFGNCQ